MRTGSTTSAASLPPSIRPSSPNPPAGSPPPLPKSSWLTTQNTLLNPLPAWATVVLAQMRADNLCPSIKAPVLIPFGGYSLSGTKIAIDSPSRDLVYFMGDGPDLRAVGGAIRASALIYTPSIINQPIIPLSAGGWKYLHTSANFHTAWQAAAINDSIGPEGTAEFDCGEGDENASNGLISVIAADIQQAATIGFPLVSDHQNRIFLSHPAQSDRIRCIQPIFLKKDFLGNS